MQHLRANAPMDYLRLFSTLSMTAALSATTFAALGFPVVLGAVATAITAGVHLGLMPQLKNEMQDALDIEKTMVTRWEDRGRLTRKIDRWVQAFSQKYDLKTAPQVLVMPEQAQSQKVYEGAPKSTMRNFLRHEFNKHANAFAFSHNKGNIVLTDPIVKALNEDELKGVVAHEMGHIVAGHTHSAMALRYISTPAKVAAGLNFLFTAVTSFKNFGFFMMANSLSSLATDAYEKFWDLKPENPMHKKSLDSVRYYAFHGSLATMAFAFGAPDLLLAQGISVATGKSLNLVEKFNSRVNEFHADRLAVEMTKDNVSLATGLEKVKAHHMRAMDPDGKNSNPDDAKGVLQSVFDRVRDLTKTHPNVDRRKERITGIHLPDFTRWFMPAFV